MRHLLASLLLLCPMVGHAATVLTHVPVQQGSFLDKACLAEVSGADEYEARMCYCEADIAYPQVSGVKNETVLNAALKARGIEAGKGMGEGDGPACPGTKVDMKSVPAAGINDEQFSGAIAFENDALLSIGFSHYSYGAGAAHGNPWSDALLFDKNAGRILTLADIVDVKKLPALNRHIYEELKQTDESFLGGLCADEEQDHSDSFCPAKPEAYVAEKDALGYLSLSETGLSVVFNVYAVGPYAAGPIEIEIPEQFIAHPAIKKLYGAPHAG
ncbi:MAG: hypothetical protein DI582_05485 [Azospirillum brasilense]|nr:MAG: hypothetical protein DI582_05485 [Azospirillum brasilense]